MPLVIPGVFGLNFVEVILACVGAKLKAWLGTLILGAVPLARFLVNAGLPPRALSLPAKLLERAANSGNAAVDRSAGELQDRAYGTTSLPKTSKYSAESTMLSMTESYPLDDKSSIFLDTSP